MADCITRPPHFTAVKFVVVFFTITISLFHREDKDRSVETTMTALGIVERDRPIGGALDLSTWSVTPSVSLREPTRVSGIFSGPSNEIAQ